MKFKKSYYSNHLDTLAAIHPPTAIGSSSTLWAHCPWTVLLLSPSTNPPPGGSRAGGGGRSKAKKTTKSQEQQASDELLQSTQIIQQMNAQSHPTMQQQQQQLGVAPHSQMPPLEHIQGSASSVSMAGAMSSSSAPVTSVTMGHHHVTSAAVPMQVRAGAILVLLC